MAKDKQKHKKKHDGGAGAEAATGGDTGNGIAAAANGRPSLKGKEYDKQLRKLQVEL